ncbi:MAG: acyl--CoA ligase [Clostridiales bacterium]|nr:acyl--CoA ligase [Clostridiales bacterium]
METKWSSQYGDYAFIPDIEEDLTIYESIKAAADKYGDRIALEYGNTMISYKELIRKIDHCASVLNSRGVQKGDTVMVSCRRTPNQIIALYAINKIGAGAFFFSDSTSHAVFISLCNSLKATYAIVSVSVYNRFRDVFAQTSIRKITIVRSDDYMSFKDLMNPYMLMVRRYDIIDPSYDLSDNDPEVTFWKDYIKEKSEDCEKISDPDAPAIYFMSGVAAGTVNTVKISSRSMNAQARISGFLFGKGSIRIFSLIRLEFSFGTCFALHTPLLMGHTILVNMQQTLEFPNNAINKYKPDAIVGYPQLLSTLIDSRKIKDKTLNGIKVLYSGGNVMSGSVYHRIRDFFDKRGQDTTRILRLYGITETTSVCMFLPEKEHRPGCLGIPVPGVRMKIINPDNNSEQMYGTTGVIAINTPSPMSGYVDAKDDNDTVMRVFQDNTQWIVTGDMGSEDDSGMFYYDGTRRRLFDRGGTHVYPQYIENEIRSVLGVRNCCAVPLVKDGETIIKVAVMPEDEYLFNNDKLNELKDEIEQTCQMELTEPMWPDEYEFMAYLPMGSFGRVDYEKIIEMFKEEANEQENQNRDGIVPDAGDGL